MATQTARVQVALPADLKAEVKRRARARGISLSAIMREITADMVFEHEVAIVRAQIEQRGAAVR